MEKFTPNEGKREEDLTEDLHEKLVEATENVVNDASKAKSKEDLFGTLENRLKETVGPRLEAGVDNFVSGMKDVLWFAGNATPDKKVEEKASTIQIKIGRESVTSIQVPLGASDEAITELVLANEEVKKMIEGKTIHKVHLQKGSRETTFHIFL